MSPKEIQPKVNNKSSITHETQSEVKNVNQQKNTNRVKKQRQPRHRRDKIHNYNIINIIKSIFINYKSFTLAFICCCYFSYPNIYFGLFTVLYTSYISYISHFLSHVKEFPILNKLHLHHHNSKTFFGYFNQFIFQIINHLFLPILIKHSFNITLINEYIILFTELIYTTVHLINYSYLHVNDIHEKHHLQDINYKNAKHNCKLINFGPDYMDILFGTKYKPDTQIENFDHSILNMLFSFSCVVFLKYLWEKPENKKIMTLLYNSIIVISIIIYVLLYLYLPDCDDDKILISLYK
jgi:hypothetical protein